MINNNNIKPRILLSTLWVFILFNMIFRDLHEFLRTGFVEEIMALEVSDTSLLFYGFILEIPIVMVLLSRILNAKTNKWANVVAASITLLGILVSLPSGDWDDVFFAIVELLAFIAIIFTAWKLPLYDGATTMTVE